MSPESLLKQHDVILTPVIMSGAQLRTLRRSYGISQITLAHGVHCSRRMLQYLEAGTYSLTVPLQHTILSYFATLATSHAIAS